MAVQVKNGMLAFGVAALLIGSCGNAYGLPADEIFARVSNSVLMVIGADSKGSPKNQGSGVVIAPNVIVTNCHVLEEASRFYLIDASGRLDATLISKDAGRDLCQLQAKTMAPPVSLGTLRNLRSGQRVYAIGNPRGLVRTISEGIIAALRDLDDVPLIQITAPISPGSSGGGLFDADGNLIGVTTFEIRGGQNLNFAIPIDSLRVANRPSSAHRPGPISPRATPTPAPLVDEVTMETEWEKATCSRDPQRIVALAASYAAGRPNDANALSRLSYAHSVANEPIEAQRVLARAEKLAPEAATTRMAKYEILRRSMRRDEARKVLRLIAASNSNEPRELSRIGHALGRLKDYERALDRFDRALEANPISKSALSGKALALASKGNYEEAIGLVDRIIETHPGSCDAYALKSAILRRNGQQEDAVSALRDGIRQRPNDPRLWATLAELHWTAKDVARAEQAANDALQIKPTEASALVVKAYIAMQRKDVNQAQTALEAAAQSDAMNERAWYLLGSIYKYRGDSAAVRSVYERLLAMESEQAGKFFDAYVMPR